jgi:hypothetical protein
MQRTMRDTSLNVSNITSEVTNGIFGYDASDKSIEE